MSSGIRWPGVAGKIALVTGGSRGIGRAIAEELAGAGAEVIVTARSQEAADAAAAEIAAASGATCRGHALDLSAGPEAVKASLDALVAATKDQGGVSLLVLNAGMTKDNLVMRMSVADWTSVVEANLTGAFQVTRAFVPSMMRNRFGRIVAITSVVGRMGNPGQANYCATKAGLEGFIRALARELGSRNITANAVAPGFVDTDMTRALPEEARNRLMESVPLKRLGQPADIAGAVGFLVSDLAAYVTGEVLDVNGGMDM